jgi:hypothetical protein
MKVKPDINDFLDGGAADKADKAEPQKTAKKAESEASKPLAKVHREQKIFRLPLDLIEELRDQAYERSKKSKTKVTETELVEKALREFFKV